MIEEPDLLSQLAATFDTRQVDIIEFAESPQFCNRTLYPRQKLLLKLFFLQDLTDEEEAILDYWIAGGAGGREIEISPFIRERMAWLKENGYKHFREIVLVGGRRCSKGFITGLSLAYKVYQTVQLRDPARHYGIDADKPIFFSCIAAAQQQAKEMQYNDFSGMVNSCGYLSEKGYLGKMQELEFSVYTETDKRKREMWARQGRTVMKDTATIRGNALPANSRTIRGSATMALVFDEFAHFMQGESDQSDKEVYSAAIPALAQFGRDALIFCNSSPYSKVGTFYERYKVGMETNDAGPGAPNVLAVRFPSWALFDGWWEDPSYVGPKKCITVSPDWDPLRFDDDGEPFYTMDDRQQILIAREEERQDPTKYKVERRGHFAEVIDAYLIPERVDQMFEGRPLPQGGYQPLKTNILDSTYEYRYKCHLDPSSTTAGFGFALGHTEILMVDGVAREHVIFDIIKRWNPKDERYFSEGVIEWEPILTELMYFINIFRPYEVTMDQFNSAYPIQWLRRELRRARIPEVHVFEKTANAQANWNRAEIFRTALYQGLVHAPHDTPDCEYAGNELKFLQEIKTGRIPRVEKQETGDVTTKDIADCMMTVVEDLIGNTIGNQLRLELGERGPVPGSPGGYPIGGLDRGGKVNHPMSDFYAKRVGEQRLGLSQARKGERPNPARRPFGGRPAPRRLPGW